MKLGHCALKKELCVLRERRSHREDVIPTAVVRNEVDECLSHNRTRLESLVEEALEDVALTFATANVADVKEENERVLDCARRNEGGESGRECDGVRTADAHDVEVDELGTRRVVNVGTLLANCARRNVRNGCYAAARGKSFTICAD